MFNLKQMIEKANKTLNAVANTVTESTIYSTITENKYYKAVDSVCDSYDAKASELGAKHSQWVSDTSRTAFNKVVSTIKKEKDNE
jgi:hypothetical protein